MLLSAIASGDMLRIAMSLLASLFLIFCVIPIHEFSHAYMAYKMGDKTPKLQGRLSLNPLMHIDPVGAVMIALIGFGWGRPCPINERNFNNPRKGIALTALAGPLSNLLLGWLLIFFSVLFSHVSALAGTVLGTGIYYFFIISAQISIYLAVLNLLPIPMFDGFRFLEVFISDKTYYTIMRNQQMISIVLIILLFSGILTRPLALIANLFIALFTTLSELPFSLF
ncbi:MAG: site-2 protease family protein [Oscillospiraceae bacterium]|nr:site-2 protease family protein [Oscillospiraceae bacterium]